MLTLLLSLFLFVVSPEYSQTDSLHIHTEINEVTVFTSNAQIERSSDISLAKGKNIVVFSSLSSSLIDESIQLKGNGAYTLLSLSTRAEFIQQQTVNKGVEALTEKSNQLNDSLLSYRTKLEVINSEINLVNSTQNIINNNKLTSAELSQLLELYRENLNRLLNEKNTTNSKIQSLQNEIKVLNQQIRENSRVVKNRFKEVVAEILSDKAQTLTFKLSYLVTDAGWMPAYDIRSKDANSPLSVTYKAKIYQSTGIDWNNVNFEINSGDPGSNSTKPELNTRYIGYYNFTRPDRSSSSLINFNQTNERGVINGRVFDKTTGEGLPAANISIPGLGKGVTSDVNGNFRLTNLPNGRYQMSVSFVGYESASQMFSLSNNGLFASVAMQPDFMALEEVVVSSAPSQTEQNKITLRGDNFSASSSTDLLYVINGIVTTNQSVIDNLDPDDIESIQILRGSDATSLYGSAAGNGAAVITTKNKMTADLVNNETSFSYRIPQPYSVPTDGKPYTVEIKKEEVPVSYNYQTVPKLTDHAYLIAEIDNWNELNILYGEANIYFDNQFVGEAYLSPASFQDSLALSLGKDEGIIVERLKMNEFTSKNFFRSRVRENHAFTIRIRNNKSETVRLKVEDQIPVSTNEEIKVTPNELSEGILDKESGIITWNLTIEPGSTQTLRLSFEVEYPKGKTINF
jgi:TonB-dependent SusC/RagA subfamily outer membrane receptor